MKLLLLLRYIITEDLFRFFKIRRKPITLQLPVSNRCNSKCKTCNIWKQTEKTDIDAEQLAKVLTDPFFSELRFVGINGGELTLVKDINKIIDVILQIKKLHTIWLISNCLLPERLLEILEKTQEKCKQRNVRLGITFSVDGIKDKDVLIRGVPVAYDRAIKVLDAIKSSPGKYCDLCDIGCTVSKYNADDLPQIEVYLRDFGIPIYFHLAVPNKRIGTFDADDYSVLVDQHACFVASEFFFSLFLREKNLEKKLKYWANYQYLTNPAHIRLTTCDWLYRNVTIDEKLNFYLCATASDCIGTLTDTSGSVLIRSSKCKQIEQEIHPLCKNCIHYSYTLTIKGCFVFLKDYLCNHVSEKFKYQIGILWLKLR